MQSRRDFLRQSACASLGVTGLVNMLAHMRLMTAAMAQGSSPAGGYKALVCVFLNGGNDSNNMLLPIGDPASDELRSDYETARGVLALDRTNCHALNIPATTKAFKKHFGASIPAMGVHPEAQPLAELFNNGELAFVCNAGTLSYPIATREEYRNDLVPVPPQLFSHSDQQVQWQSSIPDKPFTSGWGGRIADLIHASYNTGSKVSMSVSLDGMNSFQIGTSGAVTQYAVTRSGALSLQGFGTNYASAYLDPTNPAAGYKTSDTGQRLKALERVMQLTHDNLLEEEYAKVYARARGAESVITAATTAAAATGVDFDAKFASADSRLGDQLKMVAQLIAGRSTLGNNRQIFFVQVGGYDTHQVHLNSHGNLMAELANALKAFRDTLADPAIAVFDDVTTFTASDFSRTFTPNGEDAATSGSDHAWGGHCITMGGSVNGGDLYGHFNPLKTGSNSGSFDSSSSRGRWIPDTSVDQYAAVFANWLGVGSSELETIFPNLPRFDDPLSSSNANLGFL
ncbi:DUF1501 domain-containing protein [Verrucomicrobiaceae bacterium N1E253]|uniref:DUF1501 domain-containing protein n=1 Tax=Oceaniferula marina TaxID=2748318 RepID=A0A851GP15_9BACT|nr:DUF1501 domain-containing protein [Oceaniferula marina]